MSNRDRIAFTICLAIIMAVVGLTMNVGAARNMAAASSMAIIDINRVREGLTERVDAQAGLMALAQRIETENTDRLAKIEELQTEMEDTVDPAKLETLRQELDMTLVRAAAWREYIKQQVDIEKSLLLQDLFQKISNAVAELAELEGINIVLISDAGQTVRTIKDPNMPREAQVRQQISTRRVLYASPSIDITEQLIVRINNLKN